MKPWRFVDYVTSDGQYLFDSWYRVQDAVVRAECEVTFAILRQTDNWENPQIEQFRRFTKADADSGLSEIRFYVDVPKPRKNPTRVRYRAIGIHRPTERDFVLLVGAKEWMRGY